MVPLVVFVIGVPFSAQAYLDPGSGSLVVQVIIAAVLAVGMSIKGFWHKLAQLLGFKQKPTTTELVVNTKDSDQK